jgi:hypothetical protein
MTGAMQRSEEPCSELYRLAFQIAGQLPPERCEAEQVLAILGNLIALSHGVRRITDLPQLELVSLQPDFADGGRVSGAAIRPFPPP